MAVATRIAAKFNTYYAERPGKPDPLLPLHPEVELRPDGLELTTTTVLTTMVTNAVSYTLLEIYCFIPFHFLYAWEQWLTGE